MNNELSSLKSDIDSALVVEVSPPEIKPKTAGVTLTLAPKAIPFGALRHVDLVALFLSEFRSSFDRGEGLIGDGVTDADVIINRISNSRPVKFVGGYYEHTEGETISIRSVGFGTQHLTAEVFGTTREALFIVKKIAELLWASVGRERRWSEINDDLGLVTYNTSTDVRLGVSMLELLSPRFIEFLNTEISTKRGFSGEMGTIGPVSADIGSELMVVPACREIDIELSVFDRVTGKQESMKINIIPSTNFSNNTDRIAILTELPFEAHVKLVEALISSIGDG